MNFLARYAAPLVASLFLHGGLVGLLFALPGPRRDDKPLPPMELSEKKLEEKKEKKPPPPEPEPVKAAPIKVAAVRKTRRRRVRKVEPPPTEQEPAKEPTPEPQDVGPKTFGLKFKGTATAAPGTGVAVPQGDSIAVDPRVRKRGKKPKKPTGFKKVYKTGEVAPMAVLTTRPRLLKNVEAIYPERVKDLGIEGRVMLRLTINHKGKVVKVKLLRSLHPKLNEVAMKAARKLVFSPATVNRVPVTHVITYTFTFTLD